MRVIYLQNRTRSNQIIQAFIAEGAIALSLITQDNVFALSTDTTITLNRGGKTSTV